MSSNAISKPFTSLSDYEDQDKLRRPEHAPCLAIFDTSSESCQTDKRIDGNQIQPEKLSIQAWVSSWMGNRRVMTRRRTSTLPREPGPMLKRQLSSVAVDEILARADLEDDIRLGPRRCTFPVGQNNVFNPYARWRLRFDSLVLVTVLYSAVASPFELCFVNSPGVPLVAIALSINALFALDVIVVANTAVFDVAEDKWVMDRARILTLYAQSPRIACDVASAVPWRLLPPPWLRWLVLIQLVRFATLGSVAEAWRLGIEALFGKLRYKDEIIAKYVMAIFFVVHCEACLLRLLDRYIAKEGDSNDVFIERHAVERFGSSVDDRPLAQYVLCVEWALGCFFGEANYYNIAEGALTVCNQLLGLLLVSVLIADLTNTLCHLDPARNAFRSTSDCLTDFLVHNKVPPAAVDSVRDYLHSAETLFRLKFNFRLIASLSPQLKVAVSHWLLGTPCARIPFVTYCKQRAMGLGPNRVVYVKPPSIPTSSPRRLLSKAATTFAPCLADMSRDSLLRPARIIRLDRNQRYEIRYLDGASELETGVVHSRLALDRLPADLRLRGLDVDAECRSFVTSLAERLQTQQYMRGDVVVVRNFSVNDTLYIVEHGTVAFLGLDPLSRFGVEYRRDRQTFGEDVSMLMVRSRRARVRWYNAKAKEVTRLHLLDADALLTVLEMPRHPSLLKHIRSFGSWLSLKLNFLERTRSGSLRQVFQQSPRSNENSLADLRAQLAAMSTSLDSLEQQGVAESSLKPQLCSLDRVPALAFDVRREQKRKHRRLGSRASPRSLREDMPLSEAYGTILTGDTTVARELEASLGKWPVYTPASQCRPPHPYFAGLTRTAVESQMAKVTHFHQDQRHEP